MTRASLRRTEGVGMPELERLANELRLAAGRGQITAHYQPQVELRKGRLVALEALSRWQHPRRGVVSPLEFIPLAEAIGAMNEIGDVMLAAACRYGAALVRTGRRLEIAVNVAAEQLAQPRFAERVAGHLDDSGMPAALLTLELTETHPSPSEAAGTLAEVRAIGVGVSVDDVQTVDEAVERMAALPITELKVDRSVIERLPGNRSEAARLVRFARRHRLRSVAEGIENETQLAVARELGFDRAQGYLFGRPVSPQRLTARLVASPA